MPAGHQGSNRRSIETGVRRHLRAAVFITSSPIACVRVAGWTCSALMRIGRGLQEDGLEAATRLPWAPEGLTAHRRIVVGVLRLTRASCLVRAVVLQRWDADHGRPRDLVIGVRSSVGADFAAHAWLDGDQDLGYVELHRRPPP